MLSCVFYLCNYPCKELKVPTVQVDLSTFYSHNCEVMDSPLIVYLPICLDHVLKLCLVFKKIVGGSFVNLNFFFFNKLV